jgi:hypothetical protein
MYCTTFMEYIGVLLQKPIEVTAVLHEPDVILPVVREICTT